MWRLQYTFTKRLMVHDTFCLTNNLLGLIISRVMMTSAPLQLFVKTCRGHDRWGQPTWIAWRRRCQTPGSTGWRCLVCQRVWGWLRGRQGWLQESGVAPTLSILACPAVLHPHLARTRLTTCADRYSSGKILKFCLHSLTFVESTRISENWQDSRIYLPIFIRSSIKVSSWYMIR